ncbi:MAG: MFS transporter [Chloroflexota bacterium]
MDFSDQEQRSKMVLLGGLYITQFLGVAFISTAVPAILRESGIGLDVIGALYLFGLIWPLKFLWAPLIDRYGSKRLGHYRGWLILLQSLIFVSLVAASFFDVAINFTVLAVLFGLISLFSATQDIAADALGVTMLTPDERGFGNSIQTASGFIGSILGGGVVLIAYERLGWQASLLILAASTAIPLLNILRFKENKYFIKQEAESVSYADIINFFRRPGMGRWVVIIMTYPLGLAAANALYNPMLVDLGWSLDRIGIVINVVGAVSAIIGAAIVGLLIHRLDRKLIMLVASGLTGVAALTMFSPATGTNNPTTIYVSIFLLMFAFGASNTIITTMMMDKSKPEAAGTDYTLQYALTSALTFVLAGGVLALAEIFSYAGVLYISLGFTVLSLLLVWSYNDFEPVQFQNETDQLTLGDEIPIGTD